MKIELYRSGRRWGYNVNADHGGGMGYGYLFKASAWVAAYFHGLRYS